METTARNELDQAKSPYLRQHKDNPVHWQPWGTAAFARARAENKAVLLSVGYSACHWCHVMAHESFENPAIAAVMNQHFVCIKLDREERPDLDHLYQQALALMGRQGGWPLTMFLDAAGKPFWGGTYFPPLPRHGLPGFVDVLLGVAQSYAHETDAVAHNITALTTALQNRLLPPPAPAITPEIIARAASHIRAEIDPAHGGLGDAPKFPQATRLRLLWDDALRRDDAAGLDAVVTALDAMCRGGLYDHLGGGFFRYCVDAAWTTPHFEKMLDDQALMVHLLADVISHRPHPLLIDALAATIAFVQRDLHDDATGLFIASLDADSEYVEGGFYLWQSTEITNLLGDHAAVFFEAYHLIDGHLQRTRLFDAATEDVLRLCRKKLLYARSERDPPGRDDKILTDANARMIAAIATAGWRLNRADWQNAAARLFTTLDSSSDQPPRHVLNDTAAVALADDATALALCAVTLAQCHWHTSSPYLSRAAAIMTTALAAFGRGDGRWGSRAATDIDSFIDVPPLYDAPAPAAVAAALRVMTVLALTDPAWQDHADRLALTLAAPGRDSFAAMAASLSALQFYQNPLLLHAGPDWQALAQVYVPDALWLLHDRPGLAVCLGRQCLAPVTDPAAVTATLATALRQSLHKAANG